MKITTYAIEDPSSSILSSASFNNKTIESYDTHEKKMKKPNIDGCWLAAFKLRRKYLTSRAWCLRLCDSDLNQWNQLLRDLSEIILITKRNIVFQMKNQQHPDYKRFTKLRVVGGKERQNS